MDDSNIKVEYQDTPEKFHTTADEVLAFLVGNLRTLNAVQEEYTILLNKVNDYNKRGIRMKGIPKTSEEVWAQYRACYGELAAAFCSEEILKRGYAHQMAVTRRIFEPDGTLKEERVFGDYAYLNSGCELAITVKSNKRAILVVFYKSNMDLECWKRFTLTNTGNGWRLMEIKYKRHNSEKWRADWI